MTYYLCQLTLKWELLLSVKGSIILDSNWKTKLKNPKLQIWLYYNVKLEMFEDTFDLKTHLLHMQATNDVAECLKLHEQTHFEMHVVQTKSRNT